ncbi:2-succinyl-6-hydroxy-2,4-cyclohexadiene-1-carboxylate synthase [Halobacillus naozhouensis]|uniref:Putative 2-succinyl-6-hydroxy-2,4-cyclohexadiene-1-carboxylate synthase n=1 Tax=Halobacillus naozhouensis TaxID=554880 RepID=A0ABY8IU13_9BACI|nr:2-succinyl-6-hydroxy-2,4-cyclohexadiene-1-carboxylate synthase [Halobacillus naozhouensis]WFT73560.1 2-succinyl-6-hydroxy-2,4-cyclohexadiene-1-carboxylate synthase [Halobacillus naozhouensis]
MYIKLSHRTYWVDDEGEGLPVLMLHGFTGSGRTFSKIQRLLPDSIRSICIDMPGHGYTGAVGAVTMEQFAADVVEILEHLQLSVVDVLGYSMGGRAALSFAMLYPEYTNKLILESASPGLANSEEQITRRAKDQTLMDKITNEGLQEFVNYWRKIPLFESQKQLAAEDIAQLHEERLSQDPLGLIQSLEGMGTGQQPSWWEKLADLPVEVLLIVGEWDDKFFTINKGMDLRLSQSTLVVVERAGHTIHLEQPEFFAKTVEDFVIQ